MTIARYTGDVPRKSYDELVAMVLSIGLQPWQVIFFDAEKWITPTPNSSRQPGKHRIQLCGQVLRYILHHLQKVSHDAHHNPSSDPYLNPNSNLNHYLYPNPHPHPNPWHSSFVRHVVADAVCPLRTYTHNPYVEFTWTTATSPRRTRMEKSHANMIPILPMWPWWNGQSASHFVPCATTKV